MAQSVRRHDASVKGSQVDAFETYTSVLTALSVALLLVLAGLGTKQLVWSPKPLRLLRRRRR